MAKKKKCQTISDTSTDPSFSTIDLKSLIHDHSLFFDRLVEVIPARFYLPTDDKEKPWFHGLSKAAKASARKEARENIRKAKRERLDPEKSFTTLDVLKKSIDTEKEKASETLEANEDRAVTYEELRQRLRQRIEDLRSGRNTRTFENPKLVKEENEKHIGKRKREYEAADEEASKQKVTKKEKDPSSVDFSFGQVKIDESDRKRNKKGLSKKKVLVKAERLQEAKKDPEKGELVSKKHSWKAAVSRAAGVKVHDDPKLLKESMKKEKKRKEKSTKKWKERRETEDKLKVDKQKKRADNISEKIHQRKMRKIAKREKKLMYPGSKKRDASAS